MFTKRLNQNIEALVCRKIHMGTFSIEFRQNDYIYIYIYLDTGKNNTKHGKSIEINKWYE